MQVLHARCALTKLLVSSSNWHEGVPAVQWEKFALMAFSPIIQGDWEDCPEVTKVVNEAELYAKEDKICPAEIF